MYSLGEKIFITKFKMKKELQQTIEIPVAYRIMTDFMKKYEEHIKPTLKKGNLEDIKFLIGDVCARGQDVIEQKIPGPTENGAYARYRMAIQYLHGLYQMEGISEKGLESIFLNIDRLASELDLILHNNPYYKLCREDTE